MSQPHSPSRLRRWAVRAWGLLDASRRMVLNLLFLLVVILVVVAFASGRPSVLKSKTTLVLNLKGPLVEQQAGSLVDRTLGEARGKGVAGVPLRDVLTVLDAAAGDPKITQAVLMLDDFEGAGLPMLREVAAALTRFKASGKPVIAWGSGFNQRQYYLAAHASEVQLHPYGMVLLQGYDGRRNYYREALDTLGVTAHLLRAGTYKSAGETFTATGPSPEAAEASAFLYQGMWATFTQGVETARKLPAGSLMQGIDDLPARLAAASGNTARLALDLKWVDRLSTRDELRLQLIESGAEDEAQHTFRQISFERYLARQAPRVFGDAVGVIVAEGEIVNGDAPAGTVGGRSTAELVRRARHDDSIKAVVLRVNSPGGAVLGSELVRRELELTRAAGKPVVVSMGDIAASGGYWIAMAADEIMADPATLTGSIGVFALLPSADKALGKLGVHTAGPTTTWLSGAADPRLPLDPRVAGMVQTAIDHMYADFIGKAAQARKTTPQQIDGVAQGRVWTGLQAQERGLVDTLGGLREAMASAASRAQLEDGYRVTYIEPEPGRWDRLLSAVGAAEAAQALVDQVTARLDLGPLPAGAPPRLAREMGRELGWLADLAEGQEPFTAVMHCLCDGP